MNSKNQKNNQTLFINYAPKFLIKNIGPNINNINYINNININNEYINLNGKKEKKIQKNIKSGLNFNYVYNINGTKEVNNKYKLKKSLVNRGNSINSLNYEYIIDNIKNLNINNKKKSFNTSQNIIQNDNSRHKRIDKNNKEKFKTHLVLDMPNTSENSNRIVLKTEHNQKINNNKILKINDGNENNAKLINANININKQYPRKLGINFKNVINKKIITERMNNFLSKDINNNSRRYKSLNANKYENDKKEGKGIYYWNNGDIYEGDWINDKSEGKGIYYFNDGDRYEGDFKNGKFEGKGIYYYNNKPWEGDIYEGDWRNDKRDGKGIYYYINGDIYEGDFKNDKFERKRIIYFINGNRRICDYFNDGRPIGKQVILTKNGDVKTKNY